MTTGAKNRFAIDMTNETAYGTPPATPSPDKAWAFRADRPTVDVQSETDEDSLTGLMEVGFNSVAVKKKMGFSIDMDLRLDALAALGALTLGKITTTGSDAPYSHKLEVLQGDAPSFCLYWLDALTTALKIDQWVGCKITKLTLKGTAGAKWTLSATIVGKGIHQEITGTMPDNNTDPLIPFGALSTFTVGGTDHKADLNDFELNIENRYDESNEYGAGDITLQAYERVGVAVSGSFTLKHGAVNNLSDVESQTSKALVLAITSGTDSADISLPNCKLSGGAVQGQRAKLKTKYDFKSFYDATTSKSIEIDVENEVASYT